MNRRENLEQLWEEVRELNRTHFPEHRLAPILGGGRKINPRIVFVFINPTARNISSDPNWPGPRYPFIGTKQVWRVFHRAGLLEDSLISRIEESAVWPVALAKEVEASLQRRGFYLTNLVKWTGPDGSLPDRKKIDLFLPLLVREIEILSPQYIVTFGSLPYRCLTGKAITLGDYYHRAMGEGIVPEEVLIGSVRTGIVPCYFPVGRGNPRRAVEILKLVNLLN